MRTLLITFLTTLTLQALAQENVPVNQTTFELGSGLNFSLNEGKYLFKVSGMMQPTIGFDQTEGGDANYYFNSPRTYFNLSGNAVDERVKFFFQLNFSENNPLLDAWISWEAVKGLTFTAGQKQTPVNNREMMVMENYLQFPDRSLLSTSFSNTGREMGVFADYRVSLGGVGIVPQVAVTSGDGRNSFGADSRDVDFGGLKYGGRIDIYPLGFFTPGNDNLVADLKHEATPKFVIGGAASFNDGASDAVGEGHGNFMLYDGNGLMQQPDYRQIYADLLFKYQGFSLLAEYAVSTATNVNGSYSETADALLPTEIAGYFALGTAYNLQAGYATLSGYGLDLRYSATTPEFENAASSVLMDQSAFTVGVSKYFKGNDLKVQAAFSTIDNGELPSQTAGSILVQLVF